MLAKAPSENCHKEQLLDGGWPTRCSVEVGLGRGLTSCWARAHLLGNWATVLFPAPVQQAPIPGSNVSRHQSGFVILAEVKMLS